MPIYLFMYKSIETFYALLFSKNQIMFVEGCQRAN